jgi:hypothetical protein
MFSSSLLVWFSFILVLTTHEQPMQAPVAGTAGYVKATNHAGLKEDLAIGL